MKTLLIEDDTTFRKALSQSFELANIEYVATGSSIYALDMITADFDGIIVSDVRMPNIDGIALFERVLSIDPELPVILMTGRSDVPMVVSAMRKGIFDFITKPFASDQLISSVKRALNMRRLTLENRQLRARSKQVALGGALTGVASSMEELRRTIPQIASTDLDLLIEGEVGSGKSTIAGIVHKASSRSAHAFVPINFASLPKDVLETELFGHLRQNGKPTRQSRIEQAHRGTLFLDEIDKMSLELQGNLLHVIDAEQGESVLPTGIKPLNVRIIAATSEDLRLAVTQGRFRSDFYHRLSAAQLTVPPLRERKEDVPILFSYFLVNACRDNDLPLAPISDGIRELFENHNWPGNLRELKALAYRCALGIDTDNSPLEPGTLSSDLKLPARIERFEASLIKSALRQTGGDVRSAIEILGIPRKTFYDKAKRHDIRLENYRQREARHDLN